MKTTFAVILCVMLLLFSACAPKVNDPADITAIKKTLDDYTKATNAGDVEGVVALMTDKAVYADSNLPVAVGKEAIRSMTTAFNSMFKPDTSVTIDEVRVNGDQAVARGTWAIKLTPKAVDLATINDGGSWIVVFARQNDGSWKWDWVVPNSNRPLPGSTASGEDEQALLQIERDWGVAILKKDTTTLDKILATEFQANYPGMVGNKNQYFSTIKSSASKVESNTGSDMRALVFGDTAIVQGLVTEKSSLGAKDTSGQYRYTDVFVKRDGRWQCVTGYAAKVQ